MSGSKISFARGKPGPTDTVACKVSMISVLAHNIGGARCIPEFFRCTRASGLWPLTPKPDNSLHNDKQITLPTGWQGSHTNGNSKNLTLRDKPWCTVLNATRCADAPNIFKSPLPKIILLDSWLGVPSTGLSTCQIRSILKNDSKNGLCIRIRSSMSMLASSRNTLRSAAIAAREGKPGNSQN